MSHHANEPNQRVLDPYDRLSEILFGLIMVLTFTCSVSVADWAPGDIRAMLAGAVGCNIAWGIIDAILYLMACMADKGHALKVYRAVRATNDPKKAEELIAGEIPPLLASVMKPAEFASLHDRLKALPEPPKIRRLDKSEWLGAIGVFLLVFLSTFPVVLPFIFMKEVEPALRWSNAIAIVLLFLTGWKFGQISGRGPFKVGVVMVVMGAALVSMTMALGG